MAALTNIIIHCSDSEFGSSAEIRRWHLERGWKDIGYHFVILNGMIVPKTKYQLPLYVDAMDGSIEVGRKIDGDRFVTDNEAGAHALGYNSNSIGICLIGVDHFTEQQFNSLRELLRELMHTYGISKKRILGHYQTAKAGGKTCPNFDVTKFLETL